MRFRKKPIEVEASQYFPGQQTPGVCHALDLDIDRVPPPDYVRTAHNQIVFLEPGDWVIAEPDGRGHYPCKPDIFAATYEEVS